jgi:hypothetical protein
VSLKIVTKLSKIWVWDPDPKKPMPDPRIKRDRIPDPSVADPGCLSRIPDPDFSPSRIPDPKTAAKERGETKFFVIPLYVATNFTKLKIILVLKC